VWCLVLPSQKKKKDDEDNPDSEVHKILKRIAYGSWLPNEFLPTVKRYKIKDLQITTEERFAGSVFNPVEVRGIYDLGKVSNYPIMDFMLESKVRDLEEALHYFDSRNSSLAEEILL